MNVTLPRLRSTLAVSCAALLACSTAREGATPATKPAPGTPYVDERTGREHAPLDAATGALEQNENCPRVEASAVVGALSSRELDEVSGLVQSRKQAGVIWVHNDSGDSARIFAIDARGQLLAEVELGGASARDFEDIALAPAGSGSHDWLYVADTGNNLHLRASVQIYRIAEPELDGHTRHFKRAAHTIEVRYADGAHDAETLLADPRTGDLYLVEKGPFLARRQQVGVYRIAREDAERGRATAQRVATVALGPTTAGDVLADGSGIAIRNYSHARFWPRAPDESFAAALHKAGCDLPLADRGEQGEAFGFAADGTSFLTIAEGEGAPLHVTRFAPR